MTETFIAGPSGKLFVDDGGREDSELLPVVFAHSFAGNTTHWSSALAHLRTSRRAVALDMRGHGRSDPPNDGDYAIEAYGRDVAATVDVLGLRRFVLVGHSQGALAALSYAATNPDRVAGLLLVEAPADPASYSPEVRQQVDAYIAGLVPGSIDRVSEGYLANIAGPNEVVRTRLFRELRETPRATVVEGGITSIQRFDPKGPLGRYHGPTHAIVMPMNDAPGSLHRIGKGFACDVVSGTGHWLHLDKPDEFNRLLDRFLETVR
jgi:pimeloyl-ACP methyl ester carboxylesterase